MAGFLIAAAAMIAAALALVLRGRTYRSTVSRRAVNAMIHADELRELDRELQARRLSPEAHRAARDEVLLRMLDEDADERAPAAARVPAWPIALGVPLVAIALYLLVGNPAALRDVDGPSAPVSVARLEGHLRHAPRDGRAWIVLARLHLEANRYVDAAHAYERALAAGPRIAGDPEIWCELADALGMAQGGRLAGRPTELIDRALALRPDHPRALEMAGSAAYEAGRPAETIAYWSTLLARLDTGSGEYRELEAALRRVRREAARAHDAAGS